MMNRIIERVEQDPLYRRIMDAERQSGGDSHRADAITAAAAPGRAHLHRRRPSSPITTSGSTTLRAARERPDVPILGLTPSGRTARRLVAGPGARIACGPTTSKFSDMVATGLRHCAARRFGQAGDRLVITAGVPFGTPGSTNILRVACVDPPG